MAIDDGLGKLNFLDFIRNLFVYIITTYITEEYHSSYETNYFPAKSRTALKNYNKDTATIRVFSFFFQT